MDMTGKRGRGSVTFLNASFTRAPIYYHQIFFHSRAKHLTSPDFSSLVSRVWITSISPPPINSALLNGTDFPLVLMLPVLTMYNFVNFYCLLIWMAQGSPVSPESSTGAFSTKPFKMF
uniref:Uncharacterized protein n=1 Tax=Sphaerodactylus townsendi TaxID=933632 RepID=A0ACB8EUB4_9SAUR